MGDAVRIERERRFIVSDPRITIGAPSEYIVQAYVFSLDGFAIRVRYVEDETHPGLEPKASLAGKGPRVGSDREEYETPVSTLWARQIIARSANVVRKRRFQVLTDQTWEIDQFLDRNEGLWIAELEGGDEIARVRKPEWAAKEIRNEPSLDNESLASHPVAEWSDEERRVLDA